MNHIVHTTHNRALGAPAGWKQGDLQCDALTIRDDTMGNGVRCVVSHWKPTAEELKALNDGAVIALAVIGQTMPPVSMWLENE